MKFLVICHNYVIDYSMQLSFVVQSSVQGCMYVCMYILCSSVVQPNTWFA